MAEEKAKSTKKQKESSKLTTSKIAVQLEMKTNEVNKKLVELGYLEKKGKNYEMTKEGKAAGGQMKSNGSRAYALWDEAVIKEIK
ncbi:hypothetical protein [Sulfurospirillum arcachonense]|uniref:hypothetical protein n=1 Tax=Sulfurospirillum arcachonense TaxID=57666 RepID=UPI00046AD984|nr:hypothetical protein [Sulfurospirillum arcachonense]